MSSPPGQLAGKTAVVTGASAGIGEATARTLASAGARVLLVARRADKLRALAEELGDSARMAAIDLATPDGPRNMLDTALAQLGTVDILVNNAGILRTSHVDSFELDELEALISINYTAVVRASTLFARQMKLQGAGHLVNLSSIGAGLTAAGTGVYGGLKRALEMYTDVLRIELAGTGVRVGYIAPGTTSTEIFEDMVAKGQPAWDSFIPAMQPDDVAAAVLFMCTRDPRANAARINIYSASEGF